MRLLLISDTHGDLGVVNDLAARMQTDAVIHTDGVIKQVNAKNGPAFTGCYDTARNLSSLKFRRGKTGEYRARFGVQNRFSANELRDVHENAVFWENRESGQKCSLSDNPLKIQRL
jgi:hypothetical protein